MGSISVLSKNKQIKRVTFRLLFFLETISSLITVRGKSVDLFFVCKISVMVLGRYQSKISVVQTLSLTNIVKFC